MRKYETEINLKDLLTFIDNELKDQGTDLNWRLDEWVCEQVKQAYPEVDFAFEYTNANVPTGKINISVDFDIDEYRRMMRKVKSKKSTKELRAAIKEFSNVQG
jgi:hypothetical protein